MRSWEVITWVAPFFLSYNVNGAPVVSSLFGPIGHGVGVDIAVTNSYSLHRAEATHRLSGIAKRTPVDKGKGPAPPDAPKKDQNQRPATPPGQRPATPPGQRPVTPPGQGEAYKLGECGTNKPGLVIKKPGLGCPKNLLMTFPAYPGSGEAVKADIWKNNIDAYNVARVSPCDNDYKLIKISFPKHNKEGLHNRPGAAKQEEWQTEHHGRASSEAVLPDIV
jgi:hypothetical protein